MARGGAIKIKKNKNKAAEDRSSYGDPRIPDLPKYVRDWCVKADIFYGGITKSWGTSPRQCMPNPVDGTQKLWLQVNDGNFYNTLKTHPYYYCRRLDWYQMRPNVYPWGYSWNPDKKSSYPYYNSLPYWDTKIPFSCALKSNPSPKDCNYVETIALTGISHPAFVYHKRLQSSSSGWSEHDCTMADPFCSNNFMQFTSGIGFQCKFYVLSLQGALAVVEVIGSCPIITALGRKRVVPDCEYLYRHFREYLLESNGQILLVFLICRKTVNVFDDVQVLKLDVSKLEFIKMKSIGDRTLFVGADCCLPVRVEDDFSKFGKKNCVYFTQYKEGWWVYDMVQGSISPVDIDQMAEEHLHIVQQHDLAKPKMRLQLRFRKYEGCSRTFPVLC